MLSTNAVTSATCSRDSAPGLSCGIVVRVRSKMSPRVSPFQFDVKPPPTRPGAISPPSSSLPWHDAHHCRYTTPPRLACSSVYTPSQTDLLGCALDACAPAAGGCCGCLALRVE